VGEWKKQRPPIAIIIIILIIIIIIVGIIPTIPLGPFLSWRDMYMGVNGVGDVLSATRSVHSRNIITWRPSTSTSSTAFAVHKHLYQILSPSL
jgi:hypothetical protein